MPTLADQNPCAQSRNPLDMMRHGYITTRLGGLMGQHLGEGEVLKQSDDFRKSLVKRQGVGICWLHEIFMKAVQQRMRRLMRDDIV